MDGKKGTSFFKVVFGTMTGCVLAVVIAAVAVLVLVGAAFQKAKEKQEAERKRMDALPVASIPWSDLESRYGPKSELTGLQKDEAWKEIQGKKVRWTGRLLAVNRILGTDTLQVQMQADAGLRQIFASDVFIALRMGEKERALALQKQSPVTFEAVLDRHTVKLGPRWAIVTLINGRIVDLP